MCALVAWTVLACRCAEPFPQVTTCDIVELSDQAGDGDAVVLIGRRDAHGLVVDRMYRGSGRVCVDNVHPPDAQRSEMAEVAVFAEGNALRVVENVTQWTSSAGDELPVALDPLLQVPVDVWLADAAEQTRAEIELAVADMLYDANGAGIAFAPTYRPLWPCPVEADSRCEDDWLTALRASGCHTAGRLNVYYLNWPYTGDNCFADRNVVIVGTGATPETLAHEFGHAFALSHHDTATNVMNGGTEARSHLNKGQCFHVNLHERSVLNVNGVRSRAVAPRRSEGCPTPDLDS